MAGEMSRNDVRGRGIFVGRSAVLTAITNCLTTDQPGVWVVADAGMGKSAVTREIERILKSGSRYLRLPARRSMASVPYGTLGPLVSHLSVDEIRSPVAVMRSVRGALKQVPGDTSSIPVLIVDDAHAMDVSSAAILAQLVSAGVARLMALSRPVPGPPGDILALWREGWLQRFDLDPLTGEEVHRLCEEVLGATILRCASAVLEKASGGNPMLLLALIAQRKRLGHLVSRNGVWMLSGEPPAADEVLSDVVATELMRLSSQQREVLEIVSLSEPLPLVVLRHVADTSAIDALEAEGMVTFGLAPERMVRPAHPLYADIIRQRLPLVRGMELRQRVLGGSDAAIPASPEGLLRHVGWALECGATVDERQLLRAAVVANRLFQTSLAVRAASAITAPNLKLAARVETARSHFIRGDLVHAHELLAGVLSSAGDLKTVITAALLSAQLRTPSGAKPWELRLDARAWSEATERIAAAAGDGPPRHTVELSRIGSRLLRLYASNLDGTHQYAGPELLRIVHNPRGSAEVELVALTLYGEWLMTTGRPDASARTLQQAMDLVLERQQRVLNYYGFVFSRQVMALVASGRWDEVHDMLTRYLEQSPGALTYFSGTVDLMTGLVFTRQGLAHSALGRLSSAIEALRESDPGHLLPLSLGLAAYASALMGEHPLAREFIAEFRHQPVGGSRQLHLLGRAHAAASRIVMEGGRAAKNELWRVGADAGAGGMVSIELVVLELAVRLGDSAAHRSLLNIAEATDSAAARLLSRFASAVLDKDADQLRAVSEEAINARYFLIAADSLSSAVTILESQANEQRARRLRAKLAELTSRLEGICLYPLFENGRAPTLTSRERDIAILVLAHRSNKDIAVALDLSVRTVEGHLYRIFTKVGITHRHQLLPRHIGRPE